MFQQLIYSSTKSLLTRSSSQVFPLKMFPPHVPTSNLLLHKVPAYEILLTSF